MVSRLTVAVDSLRKAGKARIVSARSLSRAAVAANRALLLRTKLCRVDGDALRAENTWPPSRSSVVVAALWRCRTVSTESTFVANGKSWAKAWLNCSPRPVSAIPPCTIQVWNARRVLGSNAEKIWSRSTVGETCAWGSEPPSGNLGPFGLPGESST